MIATTIRQGEALPAPSRPGKQRPLVVPPVQIALEAAKLSSRHGGARRGIRWALRRQSA